MLLLWCYRVALLHRASARLSFHSPAGQSSTSNWMVMISNEFNNFEEGGGLELVKWRIFGLCCSNHDIYTLYYAICNFIITRIVITARKTLFEIIILVIVYPCQNHIILEIKIIISCLYGTLGDCQTKLWVFTYLVGCLKSKLSHEKRIEVTASVRHNGCGQRLLIDKTLQLLYQHHVTCSFITHTENHCQLLML